MLLVLHGARKNVGDFLIRHRGVALLRSLRPSQELVPVPRWRALDRGQVARADGIVLCGGPGLRHDFHPATFPLVDDLERLTIPVLPLALGWSGRPADAPWAFAFDEPSRAALRAIHRRIEFSSVRDDVSLDIVRRAEVGEVRRSGCTAWYHLPSLGRGPATARRPRTVVFTPPAAGRRHLRESIAVMALLRRRYRKATRYCVFHRGLRADAETGAPEARVARTLAGAASTLGFEVVDAAYDLDRIAFYGLADLHVGYRVHAHLAFISRRRPSMLLCEDGRGLGQVHALGDAAELRAGDPTVVDRLDEALAAQHRSGFPALARAIDEIEATWPVMQETIRQLPVGH